MEELYLSCPDRSPPPLLIVRKSGDDQSEFLEYVLADAMSLRVHDGIRPGVCQLLCILLSCYYAWDLTYPRQYQLLAFLHEHLLKDKKETLYKSLALMKFEKLFQAC